MIISGIRETDAECFTQEWIKDRASCDGRHGGSEEEIQEVAMRACQTVRPVILGTHSPTWTPGSVPDLWTNLGSVLSSFQCEAVRSSSASGVGGVGSEQLSVALVLMFQHSQQPAPLEFKYHADLLGDPPVLFRVLVSLLSLQPRRRPSPFALRPSPTPKPPPPASTHAIRP
ncbi:hypothetical protein B0H13DRAFT_2412305 [Mycena leptocephala]|nr:hypothetical protein B0H13DRAFT_2412305 [Mycena leptocephala]